MSEPAVPEPSRPLLRASDADREQVAEMVRRAISDGRLTLVEGDERLAEVYASVHRATLAGHVTDLGEDDPFAVAPRTVPGSHSPAPIGERPATSVAIAVMGGSTRAGDWTPGLTHTAVAVMGAVELTLRDARLGDAGLTIVAVAVMGGVEIDLRGADIGPEGVTVRAFTLMGGIDVVVDPDTRVEESGTAFMGGFENSAGPPARPDGPLVRVTGFALMGGVDVTRRPLGIDAEGE